MTHTWKWEGHDLLKKENTDGEDFSDKKAFEQKFEFSQESIV